jgi:hypothetical protein
LRHEAFLDLSGRPPMARLTDALLFTLQQEGPVLSYTEYEKGVLTTLAVLLPDRAPALLRVIDRLVDLAPVTRTHYYHPDMMGSWSIKAVVPTIDPPMDYRLLEGINEGQAASLAYLEAIDPSVDPDRKKELERQLLAYCSFDTEAMVRLVRHLGEATHG